MKLAVRSKINDPLLAWILLLTLTLIWGSSFILIKKGLNSFSPTQVGMFRIFTAGLFLIPFVIGKKKIVPTRTEWTIIIISGILGSLIPSILFAIAETSLASAATGILNALTPFMTLTIGVIAFRKLLNRNNVVGLFLGLLGTLVFMGGSVLEASEKFNLYGLLVIAATVCYGLNLNLIKTYLGRLPALTISSYSLVVLLPITAVGLFYNHDFIGVVSHNPEAIPSLIYLSILGIVGTAIALILFNQLVQLKDPVFASSVTYLIPIVAIGGGVIDGEVLLLTHYLGMIIIIYGVYLANKKKTGK